MGLNNLPNQIQAHIRDHSKTHTARIFASKTDTMVTNTAILSVIFPILTAEPESSQPNRNINQTTPMMNVLFMATTGTVIAIPIVSNQTPIVFNKAKGDRVTVIRDHRTLIFAKFMVIMMTRCVIIFALGLIPTVQNLVSQMLMKVLIGMMTTGPLMMMIGVSTKAGKSEITASLNAS